MALITVNLLESCEARLKFGNRWEYIFLLGNFNLTFDLSNYFLFFLLSVRLNYYCFTLQFTCTTICILRAETYISIEFI